MAKPPPEPFVETGLILTQTGEILDSLFGRAAGKEHVSRHWSTSAAAILPFVADRDYHIVAAFSTTAFALSWVSQTYVQASATGVTQFHPETLAVIGGGQPIFFNSPFPAGAILYVSSSSGQYGNFILSID